MQPGPWTWDGDQTGTATIAVRRVAPPRYTPGEIAALLWRQTPWMILTFVVLAIIGFFVAVRMPTTYPAHSSLLIRLGQSYVYQPQVGDAARGAAPDNDQVVQSELEILQSDAVKVRVINDIGLARLYPDLGKAYAAADPRKREALEQSAMRTITAGLKIAAAPDTAIARLTYNDKDPERAALILNTLVDEYLRYRKTILSDRNLGPLDQQRRAFQSQLDVADGAYQKFLTDNGVGDFDAEKAALAQLYSQLLTDSYSVGAQTAETQGRLGVTTREAASAQPEIGLYRDLDHTAQDKLMQLKVDLQDLLSRYQSTAQPVRELQQKIAAEQMLIASGQATGGGARRIGVNPVFQTLQTEKNQLEAQAASLRNRKSSLAGELAEITARRQKLATLEPQYQELARQRDLLSTNVRNLTQREQESQAAQALAQTGDDGSIKVIERAYPPTKGASFKAPIMALALAFAVFAAICVGLALSFLHKGYPTVGSAERALELPVLVTTPSR
jgi:uncharacterized protein involved in exopolysaccharide biosynthesis